MGFPKAFKELECSEAKFNSPTHSFSQTAHVMVRFDEDTDVVTGLKQKTNYGRPNWEKEFEQVRKENPS